jgi:hypothetical protein
VGGVHDGRPHLVRQRCGRNVDDLFETNRRRSGGKFWDMLPFQNRTPNDWYARSGHDPASERKRRLFKVRFPKPDMQKPSPKRSWLPRHDQLRQGSKRVRGECQQQGRDHRAKSDQHGPRKATKTCTIAQDREQQACKDQPAAQPVRCFCGTCRGACYRLPMPRLRQGKQGAAEHRRKKSCQ